jgi:hypothetical protein
MHTMVLSCADRMHTTHCTVLLLLLVVLYVFTICTDRYTGTSSNTNHTASGRLKPPGDSAKNSINTSAGVSSTATINQYLVLDTV